jgi:GNAT superfamily N-acetyltransferase
MTHQHHARSSFMAPCPPSQRREALLHLAATHDPQGQSALSAALKTMINASDEEWQGLWVHYAAGRLTGAVWVQCLPMNMAQLWLPLPSIEAEQTRELIQAAYQWVKTHNIRLCHVVLSAYATQTEMLLIEHGMQRLVHLEQLTVRCDQRAGGTTETSLSLQPFSALTNAEQLALLAEVGQASLDSRALREILSTQEVLTGFYHQDPQAPRHWYAVGYQGAVIGVLLLAPRAQDQWELLLMGLIPEWRGKGLGRALLNKALDLAHRSGAKALLLAVDKVNVPAKRLYQRAGFVGYAEQRVFAWRGGGERSESSE